MNDHPPKPTGAVLARELRRNSTLPERVLWNSLRAGRLAGLKFRRQHPIGPFVADFFCRGAQLVIELDGESHNGRAVADQRRTDYLESQGLRVLRVGNDDVLNDLEAVLRGILIACGSKVDATPSGQNNPLSYKTKKLVTKSISPSNKKNAPSPCPLPKGEGSE